MTVYTYVIDNTEYVISDDDQSIAGAFWKKQAVCAGYAGAVQYLLERLDIPCIYVEGDAANSTQGHAWNIVELNGQYYYVDATNGDQPDFWRVMPRCWQSIRQRSMIICVRSHRSTRRIIRSLMSFLFLRVQRLT